MAIVLLHAFAAARLPVVAGGPLILAVITASLILPKRESHSRWRSVSVVHSYGKFVAAAFGRKSEGIGIWSTKSSSDQSLVLVIEAKDLAAGYKNNDWGLRAVILERELIGCQPSNGLNLPLGKKPS